MALTQTRRLIVLSKCVCPNDSLTNEISPKCLTCPVRERKKLAKRKAGIEVVDMAERLGRCEGYGREEHVVPIREITGGLCPECFGRDRE